MENTLEPTAKAKVPLPENDKSPSANLRHSNSDAEKQVEFEDKTAKEGQTTPFEREIRGWRWAIAISAVLSSGFLFALDNTVVAAVQPVIVIHFNAVDKLPWLMIAFILGATSTNMVWGQTYAQFNPKWMYILNIFLFELGSAVCGSAPNIDALIVGRAICGIGGVGIYIGILTIVGTTTTPVERPLYLSLTGLTYGIGIVLGPVGGGGFSHSKVGWRWAFYINLLIGAVSAPAWVFLLPSKDPRPSTPFRQRAASLDYIGTILLMGGLTCFCLVMSWGGIIYPWKSGHIIGLFVTTGALIILLMLQQVFSFLTEPSRRIILMEFFQSRTLLILSMSIAAAGASFNIIIFFVPLFFQFTRNDGPFSASIRLLPLIAAFVVTMIANGALMPKFGYYWPWYFMGGALTVIGASLLYTVSPHTNDSRIYGYTIPIGVGCGSFIQASFAVAHAIVRPEQIAITSSFISLIQTVGIIIGLALSNTLFLNKSEKEILRILPNSPLSTIQAAVGGSASGFVEHLDPDTKARVIEAIVSAINKTNILVITAGALVCVLSLLMKKEKPFVTDTAKRD